MPTIYSSGYFVTNAGHTAYSIHSDFATARLPLVVGESAYSS